MENNTKTAILSFKKKKTCSELFLSRPTNPIDHKSLEKDNRVAEVGCSYGNVICYEAYVYYQNVLTSVKHSFRYVSSMIK